MILQLFNDYEIIKINLMINKRLNNYLLIKNDLNLVINLKMICKVTFCIGLYLLGVQRLANLDTEKCRHQLLFGVCQNTHPKHISGTGSNYMFGVCQISNAPNI